MPWLTSGTFQLFFGCSCGDSEGVRNPIKVCPSIGFPLPSTAQLTNPDQKLDSYDAVVPQAEPNGVYTGNSEGTYVICVASSGTKYISYWEGSVQTEGGPAKWDDDKGRIILDGKPTVKSTGKK